MAVRIVTFKIPEEELEKLDSIAKGKGISRSQAIREAIELYLSLQSSNNPPQPRIVRLTS